MNKKMLISVVLSFRNEESVIPELISRLEKNLELAGVDYELIFINDDSTDRSREMLTERCKSDRHIKLINMSRNFGIFPCVLAGFEYSSGDAVIYMDADLQDPPEVIPQMIKIWLEEKAEVVHTKRASRAGESKIKLWVTKLGYFILNHVSNVHIEPEVGDFKLLSRRAVKELMKMKEKKPFTRGMISWIGFNQKTLSYQREARFAGATKFPIFSWGVLSNFLDSALISFSDIPLKISLFLGFLVSFGAFCFLILVLTLKVMQVPVSGWTAIMASILVLGGFQLLTIGVLGLYINSIYLETKGRPNYIVESTLGFQDREK